MNEEFVTSLQKNMRALLRKSEAMFVVCEYDPKSSPIGLAAFQSLGDAKHKLIVEAGRYVEDRVGKLEFQKNKTLEDSRPLASLPSGYVLRWRESDLPAIDVHMKEPSGFLISGAVELCCHFFVIKVDCVPQHVEIARVSAPTKSVRNNLLQDKLIEELRQVLAAKFKLD